MPFTLKKTRRIILRSLLAVVVCAGVPGCKGPDGPAGPAGPAGVQGTTGAQGPQGLPGTANVIYSSWTRAGQWISADVFGIRRYYIDITAARLTQEILDRGMVLVYVKLETENNQVRQLPVRVIAQFTEDEVDYSLLLGRVRVWSTQVRGSVASPPPAPNNEFRYVLVPGGQAGRINYEKLTYQQAKEMFGLAD